MTVKTYSADYDYPIKMPNGTTAKPPAGRCWRLSKKFFLERLTDNRIYMGGNVPRIKRFLSEVKDGMVPLTIWKYTEVGHNQTASQDIKNLFDGEAKFDTPKPESLLQRIVHIGSKEGDIVLDFCLGSGTTSAVAHKMNRRWVGIEQMDYIETIAKERLKKVIAGEQGGVSKAVGWAGGGSFVYFELKKYNQEYIDRITKATSVKELKGIRADMLSNAFLQFWFDRIEFEKDETSRSALLEEFKEKLISILDENQLYLNYADMNDTRHKVTADEKALTDRFYGKD